MAYNFLACDRDQAFLLPPDLRDWLPAGHLAWFVLDVVDQLDLGPFLKAYRADGHGRAAYEPRMLLAVLLYGYYTGVRSSRQIERRCHEDIAFRVLSGNSTPDHVTIARFRVRHEHALAGLLVQSLQLCAAAGMVRLGLVALDGTKIEANAATTANRTHAHLETQVAELLAQAAAADRAEDHQHGAARGDELPQALVARLSGWPGCNRPRPSWRPRRPPASSATSSEWPSWPPPLRPAASDPGPTSDPAGVMRPPTPRQPSTPPTPTAALSAATAAPCRATTPRRPPPVSRWWSRPS
jgi:transposase